MQVSSESFLHQIEQGIEPSIDPRCSLLFVKPVHQDWKSGRKEMRGANRVTNMKFNVNRFYVNQLTPKRGYEMVEH